VALAREKGAILAWDRSNWLYLLDGGGKCQAQLRFPSGVRCACCADDGSAFAVAASTGEVSWLAPDLMSRWEKKLPHPILAAALDPFGQYLAVADERGGLHILDSQGKPAGQGHSPRPLHHLAFVAAAPLLVGSADYGLAAAFNPTGTLAWRVGLVANVGGLAISGSGELLILACFSEGLLRYGSGGKSLGRLQVPGSCRLASLSFDGRLVLAAGLAGEIWLVDAEGKLVAEQTLETPPMALALGALGRDAVLALADGPVVRLALPLAGGHQTG
jgi:hypothetical protein